MGNPSQPGLERLTKISSEPSDLSYVWWNVNVIVMEPPAGIFTGDAGLRVALGPVLDPVQKGTPPMLALWRIRLLSFPAR